MRIALISDIHGNSVALDAVIEDMKTVRPDVLVCLGDIAAGGPDPAGSVDRLMDLGCIAVQGNTDAGMIDMPSWWRDPMSRFHPADAVPGIEITVWSATGLAAAHRTFLAALPLTASVRLEATAELLAFHGSPRSFDESLTASTTTEELDEMFDGTRAGVLAGGHTHVPLTRRHRRRVVVNPGSVGMPFADYGYIGSVAVLGHAAYAVVSSGEDGFDVERRIVEVDENRLEASVRASGMPHADWWIAQRFRGFSTEL